MIKNYKERSLKIASTCFCMNTKIVIRGTGIRANRLMEYIESLKTSVQGYYGVLDKAILYFVDANKDKQGTLFGNKPINSIEMIEKETGSVLCVVAASSYQNIIDDEEKKELTQVEYVSDREFIRRINQEIINCKYKVSGIELKKTVDLASVFFSSVNRTDQVSMAKTSLLAVNNSANEIVKALFFLYSDIIQNKWTEEHGGDTCAKHEIKTIGVFSTLFGVGGAERVVAHLVTILNSVGYKVVLFTESSSDQEYTIPDTVERVNFKYSLSSDFDKCIDERYNLLSDKKIDAVCFHMPYEGYMLFYEVLLCKLMNIRTIVEYHTSFINAFLQRGGLKNDKKTYMLADKFIVLSKTDEVFWRDNGVDATYIPNPCFASEESGNCPVTRKSNRLIWVGRINQQYKRIMDTVPIMAEVVKTVPEAKLLVLGTASDQKEKVLLRQEIEKKGLSEVIELCGFIEDLKPYYDSARAMLMTSPGEGFPMVLAEAKAHGLPTIMYDLPYLEMVKDSRGVITVLQGDTKAMAEAIIRLLKDTELQDDLGKAARASAKDFSNFDYVGVWKEVLEGDKTDSPAEIDVREERNLIGRLFRENGITEEMIWS